MFKRTFLFYTLKILLQVQNKFSCSRFFWAAQNFIKYLTICATCQSCQQLQQWAVCAAIFHCPFRSSTTSRTRPNEACWPRWPSSWTRSFWGNLAITSTSLRTSWLRRNPGQAAAGSPWVGFCSCTFFEVLFAVFNIYRVAKKPGILEKPWIRQFRQKKKWNLNKSYKKRLENLDF